ncbi:MAG: Uncharacterised protein [Opitutia bacterium UBA7350]|nr:MAG: Uncharacterised protein [Opitutae bacterium UBA7350]
MSPFIAFNSHLKNSVFTFLTLIGSVLTALPEGQLLAAERASVEMSQTDAPKVHNDASIRWLDMHYQAKPDGTLMYLVTKHGLLIENSLFHIERLKGGTHANLLPWEMRQQSLTDGFFYDEPVKIGAAAGRYRYATQLQGVRSLRTEIDFTATGFRAQRQTLNLPIDTYVGKAFEINGRRIDYGSLADVDKERRQVIVARQPLKFFRSLAGSDLGFTLHAESDLEIELLCAVDWKEHRSFWLNLYCVDGERIHHRISLPTSPERADVVDHESRRNRLLNGSFELGREEWGVIFHKYDVSSEWALDASTASEGEHSLKVSLVPQVAPYEAAKKHATVASEYFEARPLENLTIAADLKASKPGQRVKLQLRFVPTALVPNRGSNLIEKSFTLGTGWQRCTFEARLPLAAKGAYAIAVAIPATDEAIEIWVDAVSVRDAGAGSGDYVAAKALEAHSDTLRYRRLYAPGEPFDVSTTLRNNSDASFPAFAKLTLRDRMGRVLLEELRSLGTVAAKNNLSLDWELPVQSEQGMYRVQVETGTAPNDLQSSHQLSLAVLREREANVANPDNRFGVNITDLREFWALERIGIGWSRFTFDCGLGSLMRQPGVWNAAQAEKLDALLDYQASFGVTPLPVLGPGMPKWASRAAKGSSATRAYTHKESANEYFDDYLNRLLDLADGRIYAIETWNEPDIPLFYRGTIEEMSDFTTRVYDLIKAHSPEIEVVGLGLATPAETHNKFLHELLGHSSLRPYDAISYHPYTEGRRHPARGDFREVVQGIVEVISEFGTVPPLWATEFGYFGYAHDAKPFVPFKNPFVAREILDEEESAAAWIQAISTAFANEVSKAFYFTLLEGNLLDRWLQGWVGPGGRNVESGFIAAATACDIIKGVDCLGQEEIAPGIWQTRFKGSGRSLVVLWSESGEQTYTIRSSKSLDARDLYNNPITFASQSGKVSIPVTPSPIYLFVKDLR